MIRGEWSLHIGAIKHEDRKISQALSFQQAWRQASGFDRQAGASQRNGKAVEVGASEAPPPTARSAGEMRRMLWTLAAVCALILVGQANALTLTNRDAVQQRLEIFEDQDEAPHNLVIKPDQTFNDLCSSGCIITLSNGAEESFEGYEVVDIKDGHFVIAE